MLRPIGIVLLMAGVFGAAVGVTGWITAGRTGEELAAAMIDQQATALRDAGVPEAIVQRFETGASIEAPRRKALSDAQQRLLTRSESFTSAIAEPTARAVGIARRRNGFLVAAGAVIAVIGGWAWIRGGRRSAPPVRERD